MASGVRPVWTNALGQVPDRRRVPTRVVTGQSRASRPGALGALGWAGLGSPSAQPAVRKVGAGVGRPGSRPARPLFTETLSSVANCTRGASASSRVRSVYARCLAPILLGRRVFEVKSCKDSSPFGHRRHPSPDCPPGSSVPPRAALKAAAPDGTQPPRVSSLDISDPGQLVTTLSPEFLLPSLSPAA